jgi:hypothetical protein
LHETSDALRQCLAVDEADIVRQIAVQRSHNSIIEAEDARQQDADGNAVRYRQRIGASISEARQIRRVAEEETGLRFGSFTIDSTGRRIFIRGDSGGKAKKRIFKLLCTNNLQHKQQKKKKKGLTSSRALLKM